MIGSRFIFIHIPRSGGTSLERTLLSLESSESWESLNHKSLVDRLTGPEKHYKASRVEHLVGKSRWDGALKLSIVRNPFDKVISHYFQPYYRDINALSGQSLERFLRRYRLAGHEEGFTCCDYLDRELDTIVRYENYAVECYALLAPYGVKKSQIEERIGAVRTFRNYREFYTNRTRRLVENLYQQDLDRFNYNF